MNNKKLFLFILFVFFAIDSAHAGVPGVLPFQGRATDASGNPITVATEFKFRIYSPGGTCYIYEDTQTITPNSYGFFSTVIGLAANKTLGASYNLDKIFSNNTSLAMPRSCAGTYTPTAFDARELEIVIAGVPMGARQTIGASAFAMNSQLFDGHASSDFVRVSSGLDTGTPGETQTRFERIINTDYTGLDALLNGTSALYAKANPTTAVSNNNQRLTNVANPTAAQDAATKNYADTTIGGNSASVGVLAPADSGKVLIWNGTNWVAGSSADSSKLPLAGGTMTGAINMGGNNITAAGHVQLSNQATLLLGRYSNAQEATLIAGLVAADKGRAWFNSDTDKIRYWTGSAAQDVGIGNGSGTVTSVSGTAPIQVATGTTTPVISIDDATAVSKGAVQVGTGLSVASGVVSVAFGDVDNTAVEADSIPNCTAAQKLSRSLGPTFTWSCVADVDTGITSETDPNVSAFAKAALPTCGAGQVLTGNGTSLSCVADAGLTSESDPSVTAFAKAALPTCGAGQVLSGNGTSLSCVADNTTDSSKVLKAGDTMTGTLNLPSNGLVVGSSQLVVSGGNVGIGATAPDTKLQVAGTIRVGDGGESCASGNFTGGIRYNGGNLQFCNGASWQTLGVSGAGITALTGDVQASGAGSVGAVISNDVVTFAKMQNVATNRLLGRATAGAGDTEEISLGSGLSYTGTTLNVTESDPSVQGFAKAAPPTCGAGQVLKSDGTNLSCVADAGLTSESDPSVTAFAKAALPSCPAGQVLSGDGTSLSCVADAGLTSETDPSVSAFAKAALPTCGAGQVLKSDGTNFSCVADDTGSDTGITELTGDVTTAVGSGSQAATIAANAVTTAKIADGNVTTAKIADDNVTFAKLQNIATARILGRTTASSGDVEELTAGSGLTLAGGSLAVSFGSTAGTALEGNAIPMCLAGEKIQRLAGPGTYWSCVPDVDTGITSETDPNVSAFAKAALPTCGAGQVLSGNGTSLSCVADNSTDSTKVLKSGDTMTGTLNLPADGLVAGGDQLVISSGNVGIGTSTPGRPLHVAGIGRMSLADGGKLELARDDSSTINNDMLGAVSFGSTDGSIYTDFMSAYSSESRSGVAAGSYLTFSTVPNLSTTAQERIRIDQAGNVGIGITNPDTKLHVAGSIRVGDGGESCAGGNFTGAIRYNGGSMQFCNGAAWTTLGTGSGSGDFLRNGSLPMTGTLEGKDGTAASPSFAFDSDPATGIYRYNAGEVGFSTNGSVAFRIGGASAAYISAGRLRASSGTSGSPGIGFENDSDSGIWLGGGFIGVGVDASEAFRFHANGVRLAPKGLPVSPVNGDIVIDSTDGNKLKYWNGAWQTLTSDTGITELTGDISTAVGSGSQAATIANNAVTTAKIADDNVTFAKLQNIGTARILGRTTAASGDVEELTAGSGLTLASGSLAVNFGDVDGTAVEADSIPFCAANLKLQRSAGPTYSWSCITDDNVDSTKVAKAGDTMTGTLNLPTNGLVVGTNQLVVNSGNVGIGTASPSAPLEVRGTFSMAGSTSGAVKFAVPAAAGSATYLWPSSAPGSNRVLQSDSSGNLTWVTDQNSGGDALTSGTLGQFNNTTSAQLAGVLTDETGSGAAVFGTSPTFTTNLTSPMIIGGTGTTSKLTYKTTTGVGTTGADHIFQVGNNGGTEAMRILNNGNVGIGSTNPSALLQVGHPGSALGTFRLAGSTSGFVQIQTAAAAGAWTMTLPTSAGTNGYVLSTNGSGVTNWVAASAGDALTSGSLGQFAASGTTSAQLAGVLSDETGTGVAVFGTSPTFMTQITSPKIVGGTGTTSSLIYQTTTGVGAAGADHIFKVGNNGATEAMRILNNGNVGIGSTSPVSALHIERTGAGIPSQIQVAGEDATSIDLRRYQNHTAPPKVNFIKYRGTIAAPAIVQSGDKLGAIDFYGSTGASTSVYAGTIDMIVDGVPGANDMPAAMTFQTTPDGTDTPVERMRIDNAGNIGIGVTSPSAKLDVAGSVNATGTITAAGNITSNSGNLRLNTAAGLFRLVDYRTNGVSRFSAGVSSTAESGSNAGSDFVINRYDDAGTLINTPFFIRRSNGQVGINTTSPNGALDIGAGGTLFLSNSGTHIGFQAPSAGSVTFAYTLPGTSPASNGLVLSSDTSGNLSWVANGAGSGVTSVATGSGLTGGTITSTGTISIANLGVATAMIANDAVTSGKILDGTVADVDIAGVSVDKLLNGSGKYFNYMPNGSNCNSNETLKWDNTNSRWICGTGQVIGISDLWNSGGISLTPGAGSGSVTVASSAAAVGTTSGALVVNGGIGLAGNIFAGGTLYSAGNISTGGSVFANGSGARSFAMNRNTTASTAGQGLTIDAGGAYSGGTDLAGGNLVLKSGIATGSGSSNIQFQTATPGSSGTSDQAPTTKMTILGNGNVGIGTMSPGVALDVAGAVTATGTGTFGAVSSSGTGSFASVSTSGSGTFSGGITTSGPNVLGGQTTISRLNYNTPTTVNLGANTTYNNTTAYPFTSSFQTITFTAGAFSVTIQCIESSNAVAGSTLTVVGNANLGSSLTASVNIQHNQACTGNNKPIYTNTVGALASTTANSPATATLIYDGSRWHVTSWLP